MKKRFLSIFLALCIMLTSFPAYALTAESSDAIQGTVFSDNADAGNWTWSYDGNNGIITISGTGRMTDYDNNTHFAPWSRYMVYGVIIEDGITSIGNHAFSGLTWLTDVTIPNSVTSIGNSAFDRCSSLTSIVIPNSVTSIGDSAFNMCYSLTDVTLSNRMTSIEDYTFEDCSGLINITIPDSITSIGYGAFWDCSSLTNIIIPNSVVSIDGPVFSGCRDLVNITVAPGNPRYTSKNGVLFNKGESILMQCPAKKQGSYTIPSSVTSIEAGAFEYCINLTDISIPRGVTNIAYRTFADCTGLARITIPNSVASIANEAFSNCSSLTDIYYSGSKAEWDAISVDYVSNTGLNSATIHYNSLGNITNESTFVGTWEIDNEKTMSVNGVSMTSIFGHDYGRYGNEMEINADHTFTYYIAVGIGGEGEWHFDGSQIIYEIITYDTEENESKALQINKLSENEYYLVMPVFDTYQIYWRKVDSTPDPVDEITFRSDDDFTVNVDDSTVILASIPNTSGLKQSDITWATSDESIAIIESSAALIGDSLTSATAVVRGVSPGTATITINTSDGRSADCEINVKTKIIVGPNPPIDSDSYIIDRVKSYTSDEIHTQFINIVNSNDSEETKAQRLLELFLHNGLLDVREGVIYLSYAPEDRLHYLFLTDNSVFSAYQYYNWLNHSVNGLLVKDLLKVDGLIFNNEIDAWINPFTYTDISNLPGVSKYMDMLYDFMDASSVKIEIKEYISLVDNIATKTTAAGKIYAENLIKQINECKSSDELHQLMYSADAMAIYRDVKYEGTDISSYKMEYTLNETSGFGLFATAMGYADKSIKLVDMTVEHILEIVNLSSKLAVYCQYKEFLQEVASAKDLPIELRIAAAHILQELDQGAWGKVADFANDIFKELFGDITKGLELSWNPIQNLLKSANIGAASISEYLAVIKIEAWCINKIVDIGVLVKGVSFVEGYAYLGMHFSQKLESSKMAFLKNPTEENAWRFYDNYTLLYNLRYSGEKAVLKMHEFKGILSYFTDLGYAEKKEQVDYILSYLEKCKFSIDENIQIPESVKYKAKSVTSCPVNVEIYAPDGTYITTLVDGVESDVSNQYGRFAVVYRAYTGDYAKVICLKEDGNYAFKIIGADKGLVDFEFTKEDDDSIYSFNNIEIVPNMVIQTSVDQITNSQTYDIDYDGNGQYDETHDIQVITENEYTAVTDIVLDLTSLVLAKNETAVLNVSIAPSNATRKNVSWVSTNTDIVDVRNGKISANSVGVATVYCVSQDNPDAVSSCVVTVKESHISDAHNVTFDANGGTVIPSTMTTNEDGKLAELPTPVRNGCTFDGWLTTLDGGEKITTNTVFTEDTTLYAHWTQTITPPEPTAFTITFNANNGTVTPSTMTTNEEGKLAELPTPVRNGYSFNGWFTALTGGTQVTVNTVFTSDATVYARWTYNSGIHDGNNWYPPADSTTPTTYRIAVPAVSGGTVNVSPTSAKKGDTVTIIVTLDSGYELDYITVTDRNGNDVPLTDRGNGKYVFTMPDGNVTLDCAFKFIKADSTDQPAISFIDVVPGVYYYDAVVWAVAQGITNGTTTTTFSPNAPCTRGQIVTFLWRAAGSPAVSGSSPFTDVQPGDYWYDAVLWAVSMGITTGTSANTFSPNDTCTRGQTVTFLYRNAGSPTVTTSATFTDVALDAYYSDAVAWALAKNITNGTTASTFSPKDQCTRGQIVTFLYRSLGE